MERQEMLKWKKAAWQKLMGAIAMLLVASIMMSATSYAWFVLSTAPEVTDLTTTAGANGALEIALQSTNGNQRADILSGVGQSIASQKAQTANTYWGNVVDLSTGYGLEHITLYPARLNLTNDSQVNMQNMLSIPTFGTDGRVTSLKNAEKTYFKDEKFEQGQSHWGVNVMGATSDRADAEETITLTYNRDFVLNEARTKVAEYRTSLREQMTKTIEDNGPGVMAMITSPLGFPMEEQQRAKLVGTYVSSMEHIISEATMAVRWALMANAAADSRNFNSNDPDDMVALGDLYAKCLNQLPLVSSGDEESIASIATQYNYTEIANAARSMAVAAERIAVARALLASGDTNGAGLKLIDANETFMYGQYTDHSNVEKAYTALARNFDFDTGNIVTEDTIFTVKKNETETNLFSAIATVIGDYGGVMPAYLIMGDTAEWSATEGAEDQTMPFTYSIKATLADSYDKWNDGSDTTKDTNIGTLGEIYNQINTIRAEGTITVTLKRSDLSAYGYSVDLALQCSKNTNLQLQQEAVARVDGDTSGQTMGSGSTMVFDLAGDLTEAQVRKLMQGIYVVLLNTDTGAIYKIAAVDPDQLTVDQLQYPNRATGTLALYEPSIKDGVLSLGDKAASITAMTADTQLNLTALVFLNGDQVDASMFSGTQALSLTGTLNLQFASSEALTAMEYTDYAPEKTNNP